MAEGFLHDGLVLAAVLRRGRLEERLRIVLRGAFLDVLAVLDVRADVDGRGYVALEHVRDAVAEPACVLRALGLRVALGPSPILSRPSMMPSAIASCIASVLSCWTSTRPDMSDAVRPAVFHAAMLLARL